MFYRLIGDRNELRETRLLRALSFLSFTLHLY